MGPSGPCCRLPAGRSLGLLPAIWAGLWTKGADMKSMRRIRSAHSCAG